MLARTRLKTISALLGALSCAVITSAGAQTAAPAHFTGNGTTYWEYAGNEGNGHLIIDFDTTQSGLAPNQAILTWAFDSLTPVQAFFVNGGHVLMQGDWVNGWRSVGDAPNSGVTLGAYGNGTAVSLNAIGNLSTQLSPGSQFFSQGPWQVIGQFAEVSAVP